MAKKWAQKAVKSMQERGTVGSLHRALGVPEGKKIPPAKMAAAKNSDNPKIRKKANFAININK